MTESQQATYRAWAKTELSLPVWHQPWWLDATAGQGSWDAAIVTQGSEVLAVLPYVKQQNRLRLSVIGQPPLTQSLGPWFSGGVPPGLSQQHRLLDELREALPPAAAYVQNWMPEITNWLPFYWAGYSQSTRYTYRLDLAATEDDLWNQLSSSCRKTIRRSQRRFTLSVEIAQNLDELWELHTQVFARQDMEVPNPRDQLERIVSAGTAHDAVTMYLARDEVGIPHAGVMIIHDQDRSYVLFSGVSQDYRHSGGKNLLLWQAILDARNRGQKVFDFEGSMIRRIETFDRSFGPVQMPYFGVWRYNNQLLRMAIGIRGR